MGDFSVLRSNMRAGIRSFSMGVKLGVVCVLALLMYIPAMFVQGLVNDRTRNARQAVNEISNEVGGQQTVLGPALAIPYAVVRESPPYPLVRGMYVVFPAQASATQSISTQLWRRALMKVPVFQADLRMDASFDLTGVPANAPSGAVLDWSNAEIVTGISDARGVRGDATLGIDGKTLALAPSAISPDISMGSDDNQRLKLTLFGAKIPDVIRPNAQFKLSAVLHISGAQRLALLAYGKTTQVTAQGDWRTPGFDGGFVPVSQSVSGSSFSAQWSVPFIARGVPAEGSADAISGLEATALGISFIEPVDPYHSVDRSLKYVLLFMGLVFLSYFIFEVTSGKRVHPAQYVLVGIAQIIFYLLLLSIAERLGFDLGFLIAGAATVMLLSANAAWVFASRMQGMRALAIFTPLYGLIYTLLRLEDYALLVGAVASFLAVAATMYFTRSIDWYGSQSTGTMPASMMQKDEA